MKNKAKLVEKDGDAWVIIGNHEGLIEDDIVSFTVNLAPEESSGYKDTRINLKSQIAHLKSIDDLMSILGNKAGYETDFYWSEGDLLLRMEVPITHIALKHLKLKEVLPTYK